MDLAWICGGSEVDLGWIWDGSGVDLGWIWMDPVGPVLARSGIRFWPDSDRIPHTTALRSRSGRQRAVTPSGHILDPFLTSIRTL